MKIEMFVFYSRRIFRVLVCLWVFFVSGFSQTVFGQTPTPSPLTEPNPTPTQKGKMPVIIIPDCSVGTR
jgi:hypothetical protein